MTGWYHALPFVLLVLVLSGCRPENDRERIWPDNDISTTVQVFRSTDPLFAGVPFQIVYRFDDEIPTLPEWTDTEELVQIAPPEFRAHEVILTLEPLIPGVVELPEVEMYFESREEILTIPGISLTVGSHLEGEKDPSFTEPEAPSPVMRLFSEYGGLIIPLFGLSVVLVVCLVLIYRRLRTRKPVPCRWKESFSRLEALVLLGTNPDRELHRRMFEELSELLLVLPPLEGEILRGECEDLEQQREELSRSLYLPESEYNADPESVSRCVSGWLEHIRKRMNL